jgi:hypothetical protein
MFIVQAFSYMHAKQKVRAGVLKQKVRACQAFLSQSVSQSACVIIILIVNNDRNS